MPRLEKLSDEDAALYKLNRQSGKAATQVIPYKSAQEQAMAQTPVKKALASCFTDDERESYRQAILPFVLTAREAYKPVKEVKESIQALKEEEERLKKIVASSTSAQFASSHPLSGQIIAARQTREGLDHSQTLIQAEEKFRLAANNLIAAVNQKVSEIAQQRQQIDPMSSALIGMPQKKDLRFEESLRKPYSPPVPHNDMGHLTIYREKKIDNRIKIELARAVNKLWPNNLALLDLSYALTLHMPEHFVNGGVRSTPKDLRDPRELAEYIVQIIKLMADFQVGDQGATMNFQASELAEQSSLQEKNLKAYVRGVLAKCLKLELASPHRDEKEVAKLYQEVSRGIRQLATLITRNESQISAYETLGSIIEDLPGIEGAVLAARLNTSLYMDLGLPCIGYVGEARIAEILRDVSFRFFKGKSFKGKRNPVIVERMGYLLSKITESFMERMDDQDINLAKVFRYLDKLEYSDIAVEELLQAVDDSQKEVLIQAIIESGYFADIVRNYIREEFRSMRALEDDPEEELNLEDYIKGI